MQKLENCGHSILQINNHHSTYYVFLEQLRMTGRKVMNVRTDMGGELAGYSEVCDLLHNEFQCNLQITGGYSS